MKYFLISVFSLFLLSLFSCSQKVDADNESSQGKNSNKLTIEVYKSPTCGCCGEWIAHMEESGFEMPVYNNESLDNLKDKYAIPLALRSCHTGISMQGYFFEGHIPARVVKQFLVNPPENAAGLAVPGMPIGSPGMEMGERFSPYKVLLVNKDGSTAVFAEITTQEEQYQ